MERVKDPWALLVGVWNVGCINRRSQEGKQASLQYAGPAPEAVQLEAQWVGELSEPFRFSCGNVYPISICERL